MTHHNSSLRSKVKTLLNTLAINPDLLIYVKPPRETVELKYKPKVGEKIRGPKPGFKRSTDFEAVDLAIDLDRAMKDDDFELMARNYYTLIYLINY